MKKTFFDSAEPQSLIKSALVLKYFWAWKTIMLPRLKTPQDKLAYLDLFSGPGRFDDGAPSTPIGLLQEAISDPQLCKRLITIFNDADSDHVMNLKAEIENLHGIQKLAITPRVTNFRIGTDAVDEISSVSEFPTLFFIDPFGYKGLSIDMIGKAIRSWGSDCIFFFNYNRISPGISNPMVTTLMDQLFGKVRADQLRSEITGTSSAKRKQLILSALIDGLREVGGKYVLPFEFKKNTGERTSHYIVFVSKSSTAYHIMKDVMASLSTDDNEVKHFEFVPMISSQLSFPFIESRPYTISNLKKLLLNSCTGRALSVGDIYEAHTFDTPYTLKNVQTALLELEAEKLIQVDKAPEKRIRGGVITLGKDRLVTFP